MARVRSDRQLTKINWAGADYVVQRIGALQRDIENAEATAQKKIDAIKADLAEAVAPAQGAIKDYTESLEAWAMLHLADFEGKQSRQLNHGQLGWRRSTLITIDKDAIDLIKIAFGKKAKEYLHIKETPDKEALARLTDDELKSVGARRKHKDVFFVEPEKVEAVDHG